MKTLAFKIEIQVSREKVWSVLWEDAGYRKWTGVFCKGSYAEGDWEEGSFMRFLTPNGEGMYSIVEKKTENEYMAFRHLNMMKNFEILPVDTATQEWVGAMETYRLTAGNGMTILEATVDSTEKYIDHFNTTFSKALALIKELSEE